MMSSYLKLYLAFLGLQDFVWSECENGCSGHGKCTVFDMCLCSRNWQGNDCNDRICEFGISFVDNPKGDLDFSDSIDSPEELVSVNSEAYPYGTSEMFPPMEDSDLNVISQSAHWYSECSNAGLCNRRTGECDCFEGFTGVACSRMVCPGSPRECSGHGICQSLKQTAQRDNQASYRLWDKNLVRGCVCDEGFYGADCSMRRCVKGIDPLYLDDTSTVDIPSFFFTIMTTAESFDVANEHPQFGPGFFSVRVQDQFGQPWRTRPVRVGADCAQLVEALETLPHRVIPGGSVVCYKTNFTDANPVGPNSQWRIKYDALYQFYLSGTREYQQISRPAIQSLGYETSYSSNRTGDQLLTGDLYLLQFFGNIGEFGQPEILRFLRDGTRPSMRSISGNLVTRVWTNGQQGTSFDYFADYCRDVIVKIRQSRGETFLWGSFLPETLSACLGDSDYDETNNVDLIGSENTTTRFDRGTIFNPHLIRLVKNSKDPRDGGFLVAVIFDPAVTDFDQQDGERFVVRDNNQNKGAWRLLHPFHPLEDTELHEPHFDVFTTKGVLRRVGNHSEALFDFGSNQVYTTNVTYDLNGRSYDGEISCESRGVSINTDTSERDCLDKNDLFLLLDPFSPLNNPPFLNMYRALSIQRLPDEELSTVGQEYVNASVARRDVVAHYRKNLITTDINTNWAQDAALGTGVFQVYKFEPDRASTFEYVAECANRGICDPFEGVCECFSGYSGGACDVQDILQS